MKPKQTFTREEVAQIVLGLIVFSGANNNQGLKPICGRSYGEKIEHVLKCADKLSSNTGNGAVTLTSNLVNPSI